MRGKPGTTNHPQAESIIARDPGDLTRLLWYAVVTALGFLAVLGAKQSTAGIEADVVDLVDHLSDAVIGFLLVAVQLVHLLLFFGIPLVLLVTRRWRLWGIFTLGFVLSSLIMTLLDRVLDYQDPTLPNAGPAVQGFGSWPESQAVASAVTGLVLLSPQLGVPWRRFGWGFVGALAVVRVVTASEPPLDLVLAVGIGGVIGCGLLLAFGRRSELPTPVAVQGALDRIGLHSLSVERSGFTSAASLPFRAELADGRVLHCKVLSLGQYQADSLLRRYRRVRMRELGEDVAYSSVRRAVAAEALLAIAAHRGGARTPDVAGMAPIGAGDEMVVIAFTYVAGQTLDKVAPQRFTDALLDQMWQQLLVLRGLGVAHRDLQLSSWILDSDEQPWLIDFSFGEPAATDGAMSADIAELLAATYAVVGAQRAVGAATRVIGAQALETGLSHLVPVALSRRTRAAVKRAPDGKGLDPLVKAAAAACGVTEPQFAPIERVKPKMLVMAGLLAVAIYVLLPQMADLPRMLQDIRAADPTLAWAAAAASVATYIGAGLAIAGSVPSRVRLIHAIPAAVAAAFVGAVAPPGVGHVGLNVRFVQKQGLSPAVAISATATKEVGVGIVHLLLLMLLAIIAGSTGALREELNKLPSLQTVAVGVSIALALIGLAAATPRARRFVTTSVVPAVLKSLESLKLLVSHPGKMLLLFSGGLILQVGYVCALYFSVAALGGDTSFATIGLIYLTVGSAAAIAPTPGGVGAVEAVLLAALTGVGLEAATALAAVFLYRLVTFWIPIPVGGLSLRMLMARDLL